MPGSQQKQSLNVVKMRYLILTALHGSFKNFSSWCAGMVFASTSIWISLSLKLNTPSCNTQKPYNKNKHHCSKNSNFSHAFSYKKSPATVILGFIYTLYWTSSSLYNGSPHPPKKLHLQLIMNTQPKAMKDLNQHHTCRCSCQGFKKDTSWHNWQ